MSRKWKLFLCEFATWRLSARVLHTLYGLHGHFWIETKSYGLHIVFSINTVARNQRRKQDTMKLGLPSVLPASKSLSGSKHLLFLIALRLSGHGALLVLLFLFCCPVPVPAPAAAAAAAVVPVPVPYCSMTDWSLPRQHMEALGSPLFLSSIESPVVDVRNEYTVILHWSNIRQQASKGQETAMKLHYSPGSGKKYSLLRVGQEVVGGLGAVAEE